MTKHEIEILNVMRSRGKTAMDIALTLQISVNTVRSYIRRHPLEDAVRMASETPSKIMGVYDRKGSLQKGKDADILILDQDLNIRAVWAMGKLVEGTCTL